LLFSLPFHYIEPESVNSHQIQVKNSLAFPTFLSWTKKLHELSLTQSLIEIAEEHARRENATTITSVIVEIGALSGVMPEAVEFAFEACSQGTLADGATLEIRRIPALGRCHECGKESEMESLLDACTVCNSFALEILKGQEMALIEMEID
jgi:hydrogenase nickel incorporation protein HypA/HybF